LILALYKSLSSSFSEVSKNNARLSNWVRLYFLKVLEVSVRI